MGLFNWLFRREPPDVQPRGLVKGESPEQSLERVTEHFRGKTIYVKWINPMGADSALSALASDVLRRFENRLRREGAVVDIPFDERQFAVSFSWHDQPLFTYSATGRESKLRPVRWQQGDRARRTAMIDDALVQGLYFFALFISGRDEA